MKTKGKKKTLTTETDSQEHQGMDSSLTFLLRGKNRLGHLVENWEL